MSAKNKWKNLKDSFRKSKKDNVTRSGQAASTTKAYKYAKVLEFLEPHMALCRTISNLLDVPSDSDESNSEEQLREWQRRSQDVGCK
ncbi:uncharacterized protein LOC113464991 [Ceratina calcarata]|uniref:Uncharacterized protein LOC113464991 n=1 Tax=Ceratina calcarata TaxID=156304 RepID=A0AAJ7SAG0_9HYME|nr:uncharacterized protein LOC113464991 [Ceratina calcarata]